MSVIVETTLGDLIFDLYTEQRPNSSKNFLKLCKMKYYNYCLFHSVRRNFIAQSGDPTGTGKGGESVYGLSYGEQAKYFALELKPRIKHRTKGTISFVNNGNDMHGSQFFVTLGDGLDFLDGKHTVFGTLAEGVEILEQLNETICDDAHKPYKDVRITHTIILEDPFDDPKGLQFPGRSPEPTKEQLDSGRIGADEAIEDTKTRDEIDKEIEDKDLQIGTKILETIGDIADAEMKPPENVLFVCKLNPVTNADDLQIIFSRFGKIESCEIIKDQKTGDSLGYGFIEFEKIKDCEKAYFKMDNVLIDDRRIHVDFCQSVGKLKWKNSANYKKMIAEKGVLKEGVGYKPRKVDSKPAEKYDLLFDEESKEHSKRKSKPSIDKKVTKEREEEEDGLSNKKKKKTRKSRGDSDDDYLSLSEGDNKKSKKTKKGLDRKDTKKRPERSLSPTPDLPSKTSSKRKSSLETKSRAPLSDSEASDYGERKTKLSNGAKKPAAVKPKRKQTEGTDASDVSDEEKKPAGKLSKKITSKASRRSADVSETDEKLRRDGEKLVSTKKTTRRVSPARSSGSESEDEVEKSLHSKKRPDSSDREPVREKRGKDKSVERKRRHESDSENESKSKAAGKSTEKSKKKPASRSRSPPPAPRHDKSKKSSSKVRVATESSSEDSSDEDERYSKKKSKKNLSETNSKHSKISDKKSSEKSKRRRVDSFASDQSSD